MIERLATHFKKTSQQQRADAAAIAAVRDPLLTAQIQAEVSMAGALAAQQANLQYAGACLTALNFSAAPNGLNGLAAGLSNLFDSFQMLSKDPANLPLRRSVVRSAQDVATQFNRASCRLANVKNDLNASIQKDVVKANQCLMDIAGLNGRIKTAQAFGSATAPLARLRERFLEALSRRVNIIVAPQPGGGVNVRIGGVTMVSAAKTPDHLAACPDKNGNCCIRAQKKGTRLKLAAGSIAGKITARDGALAGLQNGLHTLAAQLITRVNSVYNSGCNLIGPDRDFFTGTDASNIGVNNAVANDPSQMRADSTALALAKLGQRSVSGLGNRTFGQCYAQTVSALDNTLSSVNDDLHSSQAVTQMLANVRGAAHSASLDDAATDLLRYEQACAASAKVMNKLNAMSPMR